MAYGTLYKCTLIGNSAGAAGGADSATLYNCTLLSNSANFNVGGGAGSCTLYNCTLTGNSASYRAGGAVGCALNNCIVYYNTAPSSANFYNCWGSYSCSTPLPLAPGCIDSEPLFLNTNGWSNLRLQSNSPCINAGTNGFVTLGTDFDGNPRIVGGTVDMGAYECQSPALLDFYLWLESYGQPTQAGNEYANPDGDGANNWQEWRADTIPTNSLSVLRMVSATNSPTGAQVTWQSVSTRSYWLECATNLGAASPFQTVATNILGLVGAKTYTDTTATNGGPYFYRVGVQ